MSAAAAESALVATVREKLTKALSPLLLDIQDLSGGTCDGAKLEVLVVSDSFEGVPLLQRHRSVQELLADEMQSSIHALTIKAMTKAQYGTKFGEEALKKLAEPSK